MSTTIVSPKYLTPNPLRTYKAGPPTYVPSFVFSRNNIIKIISEYLIIIPMNAAIHIHTSAPGPPLINALATPTTLPIPMTEASDTNIDCNDDKSPSVSAFLSFLILVNVSFIMLKNFLICTNFVPTVK